LVTPTYGKSSAPESRVPGAAVGFFDEGISSSRMYLDPLRPGVEDLIDEIIAGVQARGPTRARSASPGLHEVAVVGTQSAAGCPEGMPLPTSW
jgi:IMP dehydrogenase